MWRPGHVESLLLVGQDLSPDQRRTGRAGPGRAGPGRTRGGRAEAAYSVVLGGETNRAVLHEHHPGEFTVVAGGRYNEIPGGAIFAAGHKVREPYEERIHGGCFLWRDSGPATQDDSFGCIAENAFRARAVGGFALYTDDSGTAGVRLDPGEGDWRPILDRAGLLEVTPVDDGAVAERLARAPVSRWTYAGDPRGAPHMGPMAQDFHAAFGVGSDRASIGSVDADGVALAAIRGLLEEVQAMERTVEERRTARVARERAPALAGIVGVGGNGGASAVLGWLALGAVAGFVEYATIGGGLMNVANGRGATVSGGLENQALGQYSTVPGGYGNVARGPYSFAAGRKAHAEEEGCFVWGDSTDDTVACTAPNQFVARATGGFYLYTKPDLSTGVWIGSGESDWHRLSDRASKRDVEPVDGEEVLARLAEVPIYTWRYAGQQGGARHMGPMAQDFHAAFGLGADDRTIGSLDADGVALAALQALERRVAAMRVELRVLGPAATGDPGRPGADAGRGVRGPAGGNLWAWLCGLGLVGGVVVRRVTDRRRSGNPSRRV